MHRDLLCFSHLRWDFVYQRPNHLMARAARGRRVIYVEEPVFDDGAPCVARRHEAGVEILTPHLPHGMQEFEQIEALRVLIDQAVARSGVRSPVLWYYTPMALRWTDHLAATVVVYDCMDHLAGFRGAHPRLLELETRLIARADLLFTGGARLHELKRQDHHDAHCFPSSVDAPHFGQARLSQPEPVDLAGIPRPRIGYAGVIDERLDLGLIAELAAAEPTWQVVLVGPIAKIDPAELPQARNIHALGRRGYEQLPAYLSGWDVAIMPFAHNEATAFISPTKTPEYLAAGLAVASTGIADVVEPYGRIGLVEIGDGPEGFLEACRRAMATDRPGLQRRADAFLSTRSWDRTWSEMDRLVRAAEERRTTPVIWSQAGDAALHAVRGAVPVPIVTPRSSAAAIPAVGSARTSEG